MTRHKGTVTFVIGEKVIVRNYYGKVNRQKLIDGMLPLFLADQVCYYTIAPGEWFLPRDKQIVHDYLKGGVTIKELAEMHGLKTGTIKKLVYGKIKATKKLAA